MGVVTVKGLALGIEKAELEVEEAELEAILKKKYR